ncbi:hypothetical protein B0H16DRAFT_1752807 [Mycena metata]|uniref:Uncharacterized protein n=1 Tax=Mycena metata TaxID=1033252 RepID=A0AAD7DF86_9AGAR|nr:hypothetical protein B0H16DRAFT_1752807 [Mycena metata]
MLGICLPPTATPVAVRVPKYSMPAPDSPLEPHINFAFQARLSQALESLDPPQPLPDDLLPEEMPRPGYAHAGVQASSPVKEVPRMKKAARGKHRAERFRAHRAAAEAQRHARLEDPPHPLSALRVARGHKFDPALIEDRDYDLDEVVGPDSTFKLCLVTLFGGAPRPVIAADKSLVALLGGYPARPSWRTDVVDPVTNACASVIPRVVRSTEEVGLNLPPTLHGGVGARFNEPDTEKSPGIVLNALLFFDLMSTLAMKRLLGYGNRLLQAFCPTAFDELADEKETFLKKIPDAVYPTDSSVYSAITFELGGCHRRTLAVGVPYRFLPGAWSILQSLGNYNGRHGGHVILWELGYVVRFPPGSTILIPTGVIHYSFVRVRENETRYSVLQYAGSGIPRWFRNGQNTDEAFAIKADEEKHAAREERRKAAHAAILDTFPLEEELPLDHILFPFFGTHPPTIE